MPFQYNPFTGNLDLVNAGGGDIVGPASATDNAVARFDGTTGKLLQNSTVTISDTGNVAGVNDLAITGDLSGVVDLTTSGVVTLGAITGVVKAVTGVISASAIVNADISGSAAIDATKIADGSVTSTEFQYLGGVTSDLQTQLNGKASAADVADLVTLSGVAVNSEDLGSFAGVIIPDNSTIKEAIQELESYVQALPDPMEYKGLWDASTNTPTLTDGSGDNGDVWQVSAAGTQFTPSITFAIGDKAVYNGATAKYEKWDMTDAVISVNSQTGIVVLDTDDISEGTAQYFTDERAQDAIGTILLDTSSVDFTYDDGTPTISAVVLPAGVNHDALQNYDANEHIDHTAVSISTAANTSGLSGGGTIAATRNLSVDILGTTAETTPDNADSILIYDNSATALKRQTRSNFLSGLSPSSPGDISETSFSTANNQAVAANVTGLLFSNATVRSFSALASIAIDATTDVYQQFSLSGIQKGASWEMSVDSVGDNSGITFSITTSGQVQYQSSNLAGFVSGTLKFRAITTSV